MDNIYDSILQTLSTSVAKGLRMYGIEGSSETARFCEMLDRAFDCLNVRHNCGSKKDCQSFKTAEDDRLKVGHKNEHYTVTEKIHSG